MRCAKLCCVVMLIMAAACQTMQANKSGSDVGSQEPQASQRDAHGHQMQMDETCPMKDCKCKKEHKKDCPCLCHKHPHHKESGSGEKSKATGCPSGSCDRR